MQLTASVLVCGRSFSLELRNLFDMLYTLFIFLVAIVIYVEPFRGTSFSIFVLQNRNVQNRQLYASRDIVSPFDAENKGSGSKVIDAIGDELALTIENVEMVLDEMRPYLKADGGNVRLVEIDGPIVKLELVGNCGTCPSSAMTMKMGLERKLKERIPEIGEVVQTVPDAPALTNEAVETVLDGVRPFLSVAGGKISVVSMSGVGGLQPTVSLKMEGSSAALQSVKIEIMQRIQRHFLQAVRVDWVQ